MVALRIGAIVHEAMVARRILSFRNILVASPELVERFGLPHEPDAAPSLSCAVWASRIDVPARWELAARNRAEAKAKAKGDAQGDDGDAA